MPATRLVHANHIAHVPHADVPIWAFGRCSRQPSWRAKRPYAGISPSKPCVAGVYLACRKTGRSSRLLADIPYGSARSGEIAGRFGDRGALNGSRLWPSIDMACSRIRSSCSFVRRPSPGRGSAAAGRVRAGPRVQNRWVLRQAPPKPCRKTQRPVASPP